MSNPAVVDKPEYTFTPQCEMGCDRPATVVVQGCMDKSPVCLCNTCLQRGLDLIAKVIHMYQRMNKKILVCSDCHRPILRLDTHISTMKL